MQLRAALTGDDGAQSLMLLTRDGWREVLVATLGGGLAAVLLAQVHWALAVPCVLLWLGVIWFFRDPHRVREYLPGEFYAPADGRVTEISRLDQHPVISGPAWRVGIFLSVFDVHINRSPCAGKITAIEYQKGGFLDARDPHSGARNEANMLTINPPAPLAGPIVVRQVAGKIARRIVCRVQPGAMLEVGQRIGMIKFGSRTELIVPAADGVEVLVRIGDKVRGGLTPLVRHSAAAEARKDGSRESRG